MQRSPQSRTLGIDVTATGAALFAGSDASQGWRPSAVAVSGHARLPVASSPARRLALLLSIQAATTLLLAGAGSFAAMAAAVTVNGATIAPAMASVFTLVAGVVPESRLTEGFAWLGTGLMVGASLGAGAGGFAVTHARPAVVFGLAAGPLAAAALAAATALRPRGAATPAPP